MESKCVLYSAQCKLHSANCTLHSSLGTKTQSSCAESELVANLAFGRSRAGAEVCLWIVICNFWIVTKRISCKVQTVCGQRVAGVLCFFLPLVGVLLSETAINPDMQFVAMLLIHSSATQMELFYWWAPPVLKFALIPSKAEFVCWQNHQKGTVIVML